MRYLIALLTLTFSFVASATELYCTAVPTPTSKIRIIITPEGVRIVPAEQPKEVKK